MLDGAARREATCSPRLPRLEMPAIAMTDHGNLFGAYDFYKQGPRRAASSRSSGSRATTRRKGVSSAAHSTSAAGTTRQRRGSRGRRQGSALHPHDHAGREHRRACTTCSGCRAWPASRATTASRAWTANCCRPTARASSARPAAPRGEVKRWLQAGNYDKAHGGRRRLPRHLRPGQLLLRVDGPRPRHRAPPSATTCCGIAQDARPAAARHERPPLRRTPTTPRRTTPCCASAPGRLMADPKRFRFDARRLLPQDRRRDARGVVATCPRRATTRC